MCTSQQCTSVHSSINAIITALNFSVLTDLLSIRNSTFHNNNILDTLSQQPVPLYHPVIPRAWSFFTLNEILTYRLHNLQYNLPLTVILFNKIKQCTNWRLKKQKHKQGYKQNFSAIYMYFLELLLILE